MEETEVKQKSPVNNEFKYKIEDVKARIKNSPLWINLEQLVNEMKQRLIENVPQERVDNIGGFTFPTVGQHVKRTEDGGNI